MKLEINSLCFIGQSQAIRFQVFPLLDWFTIALDQTVKLGTKMGFAKSGGGYLEFEILVLRVTTNASKKNSEIRRRP